MLALPTRRATYHRALGSGELIPQNERELRCSEGSGMLIGDPLRQWFSNGGTCTPRGTWGYCRGYVRDIIISLSLDIPIISLYFKAKRCVVKGYLA